MIDVDMEEVSNHRLDDQALEVAVDRAVEADNAGLEPGEVLEHAICGYMVALKTLGFRIVPPDQIALPRSRHEATLMLTLARNYLGVK